MFRLRTRTFRETMSSNGTSNSGCVWITLVVLVVGALFYVGIIQPDEIPGLRSIVNTVAGFFGDREEAPEVPPFDADETRTWTSRTGTMVEASVIDVNGAEVRLEKPDGQVLTVKRSDFSETDRRYLEQEYGSEEEIEIPRAKPRVRVSVALKSWRVGGFNNQARGAISLRNLDNNAFDDVEVFWTFAKKRRVYRRINTMSLTPHFHSAERARISLAPGESIVINTTPTNSHGSYGVKVNDCLIVQVFVNDELVSFDASRGAFDDWAEKPDLQKHVKGVALTVPEITNSLGNSR